MRSTATVVLTTFNQRRYLADALDSIMVQTVPAEVIVVDDGSGERVDDIVSRYPGVRLIRQDNGGVAVARNTGLAEVSTEFVTFLDGDDRLLPNAVASGVQSLRRFPSAGQTAGRSRLMDDAGNPFGEFTRPPTPHRSLYAELLRKAYACPPAVVTFRAEVVRAVGGFDKEFTFAQDYELLLRVGKSADIAYHGDLVAEYRMHQGQRTNNNSRARLYWIERVLAAEEHYTRDHPDLERARRAGLRHWRLLSKYPVAVEEMAAAGERGESWRPRVSAALWRMPSGAVELRHRNALIRLRRMVRPPTQQVTPALR